ncbi:hypothetical protein [Pelagibacterium montanilacus]|uniref:hypothetical protein n=1 Tax=Pelagibacterium montanilacus TaxID=2185280 RepID=UPI000F8C6ADC|nr:hypothetical protein [Pelagibacterium montanilacus]
MNALNFGNVPVPYTVLWSAEDPMHIAKCEFTRRAAVCNAVAPGVGKPIFGKPHMQRQREVVVLEKCDLCAKPLKGQTKVSLSHARPRIAARGQLVIMQVEALVHKDCAAICLDHCPSLRADIRRGSLVVRMVTRYQVQVAQLTGAAVLEFTGEHAPGCVGHAKIVLQQWKDKDEKWLR